VPLNQMLSRGSCTVIIKFQITPRLRFSISSWWGGGGRNLVVMSKCSQSFTHTPTPRRYNPCRVLADSNNRLQPTPPISYSQPFCIPHHSIHPSEVWTPHSPSTLRLIQGDFLHGRLSSIRTICPAHLSLDILIAVTKLISSYR
jgi:hypothetical protein